MSGHQGDYGYEAEEHSFHVTGRYVDLLALLVAWLVLVTVGSLAELGLLR